MVGLLGGSLALAVPLVFGALGGVLGERAGVVNIAIDGQLLAGAFAAAIVGSITGSTWAGLLGAMAAGALVALVLGIFAISYFVDQVIVGVVLNVLVIGVTSFMFSQVLTPNTAALNSPPRFGTWDLPVDRGHPADRSDLVPTDPDRLPALRRRRRRHLGSLPHPVGAPRARGGRAPQGSRHGRDQRHRHPLPHRAARGRHRRCWRGVLHVGIGSAVQPRDDRRCWLHRPRRGDLRQVGPDSGDPRRTPVRLRARTSRACSRCWAHRCRASSC